MPFLSFWIVFLQVSLASIGWPSKTAQFEPSHRLSGIGVDRAAMTPDVLAARTERMIETQTFSIMREPQALAGAQRINNARLQRIFRSAAESAGVSAPLLSAIAYLESWGNPRAESPAGPKGIMQFSEATARAAGLQIVHATRYHVTRERRMVRTRSGRKVMRTVRHKEPYVVTVRDDRFYPERAIPAAARYLAHLKDRFGGEDWAVFAYHCGAGCVADIQEKAEKPVKERKEPFTVASMFFAASPAQYRELYDTLQFHMQRDYSPTYWFRIMRAKQLLALYSADPEAFQKLVTEYRNDSNPEQRANHRLIVWLKNEDLLFRNCDDLRAAAGKKLVRVFENPKLFGFELRSPETAGASRAELRQLYEQASPSTVGTLVYLAYETRRLFEAMHPGEKFVPLPVTELVSTLDDTRSVGGSSRERSPELPAHCTGQVFDIETDQLPHAEREALNFILDEMGWDGYLGFIHAVDSKVHIGCSPSSREFFSQIYQEAVNRNS